MRDLREEDVETFPVASGEWMARYDQQPSVAVVAPTEDAARRRLTTELAEWRKLLEAPTKEPAR